MKIQFSDSFREKGVLKDTSRGLKLFSIILERKVKIFDGFRRQYGRKRFEQGIEMSIISQFSWQPQQSLTT